ncbi:Uncharacterised protein [Bordetella pertussis]|nr:Uncharacterised protein [Bordetella pertussis]
MVSDCQHRWLGCGCCSVLSRFQKLMGLGSTKALSCSVALPSHTVCRPRPRYSEPSQTMRMRRPRSAGLKGRRVWTTSMRLRTSTDSIGASVARSNSNSTMPVSQARMAPMSALRTCVLAASGASLGSSA